MTEKICFIVTAIGESGTPTRERADNVYKYNCPQNIVEGFFFNFFHSVLLLLKFFPGLVDSQLLVNTKFQVITTFSIFKKLSDS